MTIPAIRAVQVAGVEPMNLADRTCERIAPARTNDKVDMIGHKAVGPELQTVALADASEDAQIVLSVAGREKDIAAAVSAMGHMVRQAGNDDSRCTWHCPVKT